MKKYRQLTFRDRIYIEAWHWERKSLRFMAQRLGVHPSTISRELRRGATGTLGIGYMSGKGESFRIKQAAGKGRRRKIEGWLESVVRSKLFEGWSPEQISGRLKIENKCNVSHETIYQYIKSDREQGGRLYLSLRHGKRRRKKRFAVPRVRAELLNRLHISSRSHAINKRKRIGDWERDLVFGDSRKAAVLVFVERKTRFTLIRKVESKSPKEIGDKTIEVLRQMTGKVTSLTNDNGIEFRDHQRESRELKIPIYFTNPYSSWEKGTCENINGLIRQYFPKKSSIKEFTDETAKQIETALNTRPRKTLGFQTPMEAFSEGKIAVIF